MQAHTWIYHIKAKDSSVVLYSRDALSGSLVALVALISQIRRGEFIGLTNPGWGGGARRLQQWPKIEALRLG